MTLKPPAALIVNIKLFHHLFYSQLLFQYRETLSCELSSFSSQGSKPPSELALDTVHHSTPRFFSPYPERTVKACTSHPGTMMAHSDEQGHLRYQRFSKHEADFTSLHGKCRAYAVLEMYRQRSKNPETHLV